MKVSGATIRQKNFHKTLIIMIKGTIDRANFALITTFVDDNPRSIAMLHNCSINHAAEAESSFKQSGILCTIYSRFKSYLKSFSITSMSLS